MYLRSPAFRDGADIPRKYTQDGQDVSPPLEWGDVPAAAPCSPRPSSSARTRGGRPRSSPAGAVRGGRAVAFFLHSRRDMTVFRDRRDAGRQLAQRFDRLIGKPGVVVLALPRGGVPVG